MRILTRAAAVAGCFLLLSGVQAFATDLRGMVGGVVSYGYAPTTVPRQGVPVTLTFYNGAGLQPIAQTYTNPQGFYFFFGVRPGNYVLIVGNLQFPLGVGVAPVQDIPIIIPPG